MKIESSDLHACQRLTCLHMKSMVPRPFTKEEKIELVQITQYLENKYGKDFQKYGFNFITGEILTELPKL